MAHSQEFVEYTWDIQPNHNILFLVNALMGDINALAQHLHLPKTARSRMQPAHHKDPHAAALGQHGGQKRMEQLNAQERSAFAKHAMRTCWHPCEVQAARERAQEITYLIKQALKDGKQLHLI